MLWQRKIVCVDDQVGCRHILVGCRSLCLGMPRASPYTSSSYTYLVFLHPEFALFPEGTGRVRPRTMSTISMCLLPCIQAPTLPGNTFLNK